MVRLTCLGMLLFWLTASVSFAQDEPCTVPIGSRVQTGQPAQFITDSVAIYTHPTPESDSYTFNNMIDRQPVVVLDGPRCAGDERYWQIEWHYGHRWVLDSTLGYTSEAMDDYTLLSITPGEPITVFDVTVSVPDILGDSVYAHLRQTEPSNGFRIPRNVPMLHISFPQSTRDEPWDTTYWDVAYIAIFRYEDAATFVDAPWMENWQQAITTGVHPRELDPELYSLPSTNATEVIMGDLEHIEATNGQGLRYVTYFSQFTSGHPSELLYTYMGIAGEDDNQYVVTAKFPVMADYEAMGFIPPTIPPPTTPGEGPNFVPYSDAALNALTNAATSHYTPDLSLLDAMMASIMVETDFAAAGFDTTN